MRLTPRKDEIDRVVAILEDDTHPDATQMAKTLIKEIAGLLWMRTWYAAIHRPTTSTNGDRGGPGIAWAPFASPTQATTTIARTRIGGRISIVTLHSPAMLLAQVEGKLGWPGFCATPGCAHAPHTHAMAGSGRGACVLSTCPCTRFRKEPSPPR